MSTVPALHAELLSTLASLLGLMDDIEEKAVNEWLPQTLGQQSVANVHECHTVSQIGQAPGINGVQLAQKLNITRGGMSKILTKLVQKKLVVSSRSDENKKEVYYHLTETGHAVFMAHAQIHQNLGKELLTVLASYPDKDLKTIKGCLDKMTDVFWQASA